MIALPRRTASLSSSSVRLTTRIAILLGLWFPVVIFTTSRHEYFRDEVRAWSLARVAHSPLDLFHLIRYEGHPILWYLLLYLGKSINDTPLVLPITSLAVAAAAVTIFMLRSPFPLWMKALFLFCALPLYEYSVMARNHGLSMLLLFVVASLYPSRSKHWLTLAIALALLANANIHATLLTGLITAVWVWEDSRVREGERSLGWRLPVAVAIVGLGVLLSVIVVSPPRDTILTAFYSTTGSEFASAFLGAVLAPGVGFRALFPWFVPAWIGSIVLYVAVLGLVRRPILCIAALGGLVSMGLLFRVAYIGYYRHCGIFLCFLLCLYWIALERCESGPAPPLQHRLFEGGLYGGVLFLVLASVHKDRGALIDIRSAVSSSKAFGALLNASPEFHDAILVPEPDYFVESVPYYAHNPIYFPREHRFGTTVTWSTAPAAELSLGQLVLQAQTLKAQYGRTVLVVLGHSRALSEAAGDIAWGYNKRFTWTAADRQAVDRSLTPVAKFVNPAGDENYWIFAVK